MTKGLSGIRQAAAEQEARRAAGGGGQWVERFKLAPGESAVVRFLEQDDDVAWCYVHQLPPKQGQNYGDNEVCWDQDNASNCPGCERMDGKNYRRIVNGWVNLIHRDAPVWKRTSEGRLEKDANNQLIQVGTQDQVKVWRGGIKLFKELDGMNSGYKGLMSRDFRVTRHGEGLATEYDIFPVDPDGGPQPMTDLDKELAKTKTDLNQYTTPPPRDEWGLGVGATSGSQPQQGTADGSEINPFLAARNR